MELLVDAFIRTHNRARTKERHIKTAIDLIDAKILHGDDQLKLSQTARGVLPNAIMGILNATKLYGNKAGLQIARKLLVAYSSVAHAIVTVTAAYTPIDATSGTLSATVASTQSTSFTYLWSQTAGPNTATLSSTSAAAPTASALVSGTYTFKVVVTDSQGNSAEDTVDAVIA